MRGGLLVLGVGVVLAAACKRAAPEQRTPIVGAPSDAALAAGPADAPAPADAPTEVELLHAVPTTIAVSSVVANAALPPHAIADGSLATAWNSRTKDLVGSWVAIRIPATARVTKIRLTAGFTATGPEGDYFTLNHRIRRVRITKLGGATPVDLGTHELDVTDRDLQELPVDTTGGDIKLELVELVPGTRARWREAVISELEVWGTAPDAQPGQHVPAIAIGGLGAAPVVAPTLALEPPPSASSIEAYCAARAAREPPPTYAAPPACGAPARGPALTLPAGWTASYFLVPWGRYQPACAIALHRGARVHVLEDVDGPNCGANDQNWCATRQQTIVDGTRVAVLTTRAHASWRDPAQDDVLPPAYAEELRACVAVGDADLACSAPIRIGEVVCAAHGGGAPGADGLVVDEERWALDVELVNGWLTVRPRTGVLDEAARDSLGRFLIRAR